MKKIKYFLTIAASLVLAVTILTNCGNSNKNFKPFELSLPDPQGEMQNLSDYEGKVVMIVFWATWCGACTEEMPTLNKLHEQFADKGLVILGFSIDEGSEAGSLVQNFVEAHQINFPVLMADHNPLEAIEASGIRAVPSFFLYGKDGQLIDTMVGGAQPGYWEVAIREAL